MRLIVKKRAAGKTTELIYTSEAIGYPIVTDNENAVKFIKDKAQQLGCKIPEPITVRDLRQEWFGKFNSPVLIDEAINILENALEEYLGTKVICATITQQGDEDVRKTK